MQSKLLRKKGSKQLETAMAIYNSHKDVMDKMMIDAANDLIDRNVDLDSEEAYNLVFDDGTFEPWWNVDESYLDMTGDLGNEDDETEFMSKTWEQVLSQDPKYSDIVKKFEDIRINGL